MTDDSVEQAREREHEEAEHLHDAEQRAEETLEQAERLQREAEQQELPTVEPPEKRDAER